MLPAKQKITLASLMKDYADYNLWANSTLIEWLKAKPSELMEREVPSSFASLRETLIHIWDTQRFWLAVLKEVPPPASFRMQPFEGTTAELFDGLLRNSEQFALYVNSLTEPDLQEDCHLDTPWVRGSRSRTEFIHHCMNHSIYHRGQLITIGRNLDLTDAPMTDYNFYNMVVKEAGREAA